MKSLMKKNMIVLAISSAVVAPVALADAPTLYGKVNMAVDHYSVKDEMGDDVKTESGTQVNSRASRLGVKGSEELGNDLKAVYKFEFEVQIDKGDTLKNRNQYVGLAGGFGTVFMGRHDTPFKMAQGKDLFNDSPLADIGKMAGGVGYFKKGGENRLSNVLAYASPSFSGVKIVGAFIPKEDGGSADDASSLIDAASLAVMYGSKKKGLYLTAAMDSLSEEMIDGNNSAQHTRLVAQYAGGGLIANAMFQDFGGDAIKDSSQEASTFGGAVAYKVGNFMPKLQAMQIDRKHKDFEDSFNYAVGFDYSLGKKTTVFAEYAMIDNDGGAKDTKAEKNAFSVGLSHKF